MNLIVNPLGRRTGDDIVPAVRPQTLDGAILGVHINGKEYSEVVLRRMAAQLSERFKLKEVRFWDKKYPATPSPFIDEMAATCTFVLNGVGH